MKMKFEELMRPSDTDSIKTLRERVKEVSSGNKDERFWFPSVSNGKGNAIIRLIPGKGDDNFVRVMRHGVNFKGIRYFGLSPMTFGNEDPIADYSSSIYDEDNEHAKKFWPMKSFVCNILVLEDKANPENVGKVFLWKFGAAIFKTLTSLINPTSDRIKAIDPFNFIDGCDLHVSIYVKKENGNEWNQYDQCKFLEPTKVLDGDEKKIRDMWEKTYDLEEDFLKNESMKSYDELIDLKNKILLKEGKSIDKNSRVAMEEEDFNQAEKNFSSGSDSISKEDGAKKLLDSQDDLDEISFDDLDIDDI